MYYRDYSVDKYAKGGEIAKTILSQLGGANRLNAMTGAYNFIDNGNGLSFKIKNSKANYIKIVLNGSDLYDLEVGKIRGNNYKIIYEATDIYFDNLKKEIEDATGMYLSLGTLGRNARDGGMMEKGGNIAGITEKDFANNRVIKRGNIEIELSKDFPTHYYAHFIDISKDGGELVSVYANKNWNKVVKEIETFKYEMGGEI